MPDDLGVRLVRAGLVTRELLTEALAGGAREGGALADALVEVGMPEDALVGFFLADGFGPLTDAQDLLVGAVEGAIGRIPGEMAHALRVLPVGSSAAGLVVAMADPSDEHALGELRRAAAGPVLPTVARVTDLKKALERHYPGKRPSPRPIPEEGAPLLLVRPKRDRQGPPRSAPPPGPSAPPASASSFEPRRATAPFESPGKAAAAVRAAAAAEAAVPEGPSDLDRWADLSNMGPLPEPPSVPPPRSRSATWRPPSMTTGGGASRPPGDIGATLAAMEESQDRDEVVALACEAAVTVGRSAVFLAHRKGSLQGWSGVGAGVSNEALSHLWVPTDSPSMFEPVLGGTSYEGAYGGTAADRLYRSAVGAQGRRVVLEPVRVGARVVGVLCVDEPRLSDDGLLRIRAIASAVGEAFQRILRATR